MFAQLLQRLAAASHRITQTLHRHLLTATKLAVAPLLVGTLADLVRSMPALVLENALLRQRVIGHPAAERQAPTLHADRSRAAGATGQPPPHVASDPAHRPTRHPAAMASPTLPSLLAAEVAHHSTGALATSCARDGRPDPPDGRSQSHRGHRADPRGTSEAALPGRQEHYPAVSAWCPPSTTIEADLCHVPAQPWERYLGGRFPAQYRPALQTALRRLRPRYRFTPTCTRRRDPPSDRCLGGPATARGRALRPASRASHPR